MSNFNPSSNAQDKYKVIDQWTMGQWHCAVENATIILQPAPDFDTDDLYDAQNDRWALPAESQYQITLNGQNYSDTYWLSGTTLKLNNYATFELLGLDENNLYMQDAFAAQPTVFHFKKVGGNNASMNTATNQHHSFNHVGQIRLAPSSSANRQYKKDDPTVIASQNGLDLTEGHFQRQLVLTEFVLAANLDPNDLNIERNRLIQYFKTNPQGTLQNIQAGESNMQQFHQLQDPTQIGLARASIIASILAQPHLEGAKQNTALIQKYNPVLAFDANNNIALLERDLDALVKIAVFENQLKDPKFNMPTHEVQQFKQSSIQNYPNLSLAEKQYMATLDIVYTIMANEWNKLGNSQKQQFAQQMVGSNVVATNTTTGNSGNFQQAQAKLNQLLGMPAGGSTNGNNGKMDWNTYNAMSRMSLQNHVNTMNTLESWGGTGTYWKVTNY